MNTLLFFNSFTSIIMSSLLPLKRQVPLLARQRFLLKHYSSYHRSYPMPAQRSSNGYRARRSILVASGTSLAIIGLVWGAPSNDIFQDPRDRDALSTVPLSKLISGWM